MFVNFGMYKLIGESMTIETINNLFYLYHVHANNYNPLYYLDGFKLPNSMELTFVNKKYEKDSLLKLIGILYDNPNADLRSIEKTFTK